MLFNIRLAVVNFKIGFSSQINGYNGVRYLGKIMKLRPVRGVGLAHQREWVQRIDEPWLPWQSNDPIITLVWLQVYHSGGTHLMVITKKFIQEVNRLVGDKSLVLGIDKAMPVLLWESSQDVIVLCIELNLIFIKIIEKVFGAQYFSNLD